MKNIHSVTGPVDVQSIRKTMIHEHLVVDLSGVRGDTDSILANDDALAFELNELKAAGINTIVEVSNIGMGRQAAELYEIAQRHGIIVIASTGFYKEPYYPAFVFEQPVERLAERMIRDIAEGMDGTTIKAGLIAEIGSSLNEITDAEQKVFLATAMAHKVTGAPISTHCEIGTMGGLQLALLEKLGVDPRRVTFGHQDLNTNTAEQRLLLQSGAYIQFDTFGKTRFRSDDDRADNLVRLLDEGFENQIMLSVDISRKSYLQLNGGHGYSHLFHTCIPLLADKGMDEVVLNKLLTENPRKFLAF